MSEFIKRIITGLILTTLIFYLLIFKSKIYFSAFISLVLILILLFEWPKLCQNKLLWLLTPIYPILPFLIIINQDNLFNILIITLAFANDTGSYIFGKLFGKNKIIPQISPGKTVEGIFGGLVFTTILLAYYYSFYNFININSFIKIIIPTSFIISLTAFFGDLFESYLKRNAQIKDSSSILPGHGGLLDRFDSILFLAILFFILSI